MDRPMVFTSKLMIDKMTNISPRAESGFTSSKLIEKIYKISF
jgi:hypothetical protein